jgi:hypothetical protein
MQEKSPKLDFCERPLFITMNQTVQIRVREVRLTPKYAINGYKHEWCNLISNPCRCVYSMQLFCNTVCQ